jgi:hypothetical protein
MLIDICYQAESNNTWLFSFNFWNKGENLETKSIEDKTFDTIINAVIDLVKNSNKVVRLFTFFVELQFEFRALCLQSKHLTIEQHLQSEIIYFCHNIVIHGGVLNHQKCFNKLTRLESTIK